MKHLILIANMLIALSYVNAQTWRFSNNGDNYIMTKTAEGVYRLDANFSSGKSCKSVLKRYQVRYDDMYSYKNYTYNINGTKVTTGTAKYEEYCTERIISGSGTPWKKVIIRWLSSPICLDSCRNIEIFILNNNDEVYQAFLPIKL